MDPLTLLLATAVTGVTTGAVAVAVWAVKRWNAKYQKIWIEAAERAGGVFKPAGGPWYRREPMSITTTVREVEVLLDHYTVSTGNSSQTFTRVRARAAIAGDLQLKLKRSGLATGLSRSLGFQDVKTGDELFDDQYMVKASDEDLARAWLGAEERAALMRLFKYEIKLKKRTLQAVRAGIDKDPASVVNAIQAVGTLGSASRRILQQWRQLALQLEGTLIAGDLLAWSPLRGTYLELVHRGVQVKLDTLQETEGLLGRRTTLLTRVCCQLVAGTAERLWIHRGAAPDEAKKLQTVGLAPGSLPEHFEVASESPQETAERLTPEICGRLARLHPVALQVDGQSVTVLLEGLVLHDHSIRRAMDLAVDLASSFSQGMYR